MGCWLSERVRVGKIASGECFKGATPGLFDTARVLDRIYWRQLSIYAQTVLRSASLALWPNFEEKSAAHE
jgi:hypothetical protein